MRPEWITPSVYRLEDLREWHVVTGRCGRCRHAARIRHEDLKRGRSGKMRLHDLWARLRCTQCNALGRPYTSLEVRNAPRNE